MHRKYIFANCFALGALAVWGQSYHGGVRGTVRDSTAAAVPGALVTLTEESTNVKRRTVTNNAGEYVFTAAIPSVYTVTAESNGFRTFQRGRVRIATQQFLTLDVTLEVGPLSENVVVSEEVPLLETSNASTGQVMDRQKLVDLPNLGRNPFLMSKIAQNVVPVGDPTYNRMQDQSGSSRISIAGGPVRSNNYLLDGVPITDSLNRAVIIPTIEAVEEVKVQANTYDAEMGRTGGGVFNTYMKSGSNTVHGSAFGYFRETEWLANTFFNNRNGIRKIDQPFRNWGGSLGGPVWGPKLYDGRNRTFFWLGWEAYRQSSARSEEFALATPVEIGGDFSGSLARTGGRQIIYDPLTTRPDGSGGFRRDPFPGNVLPSNRINPVGRAIARTYPAPTRPAAFYGDTNYAASVRLIDRADQATIKLDHQVRPWWRATLSYLHYGSREPGENWFGTVSSPAQWLLARKVDSTQFNNVLTPNPTTVVSLRYGFNRFPNDSTVRSAGFNVASLGFPASFVRQIQQHSFPSISMEALRSLGGGGTSFTVYHSRNLLGSISKFVGRHSLKSGVDYRRLSMGGIEYGVSSGSFSFNDLFTRETPVRARPGTGSSMASLLLGYPSGGSGILATHLAQYVDYYAGYFQDDLRLTPNFTLNLGLRYEYETGLRGRGNQLIVGFDRTAPNPIPLTSPTEIRPRGGIMYAGVNGYPTTTGNANRNKFGPRVGVAWRLNERTSVRGGYGLFWAPVSYDLQNPLGYTQTTPYVASNDGGATPAGTLSDPFPNGLTPPAGNTLGLLAGVGQSVSAIDQNHRSPRIHQFSFDVQRELPHGLALSLGYVGSRGRRLVMSGGSLSLNQLEPRFESLGNALIQTVPNPFYAPGASGFIGSRTITRSQLLRPYPQFTNVSLGFNDLNHSRYDSLVVKVQKRLRGGLSLLSTWTWSKNWDASLSAGSDLAGDGGIQDNYNYEAEYSLSAIHTPHRWATAISYELPFGAGRAKAPANRALELLAGGWSINLVSIYQSGFPLAIGQQGNNNRLLGAGQRPTATGISPQTPGTLHERLDNYLNPAAFTQTPQFVFSALTRTIGLRGPGQANWDVSLFKTFQVAEQLKAQFRAEALNAMNTPHFQAPGASFGSPSFGKIRAQEGFPRLMQLGVRVFF